MGDRLSVIEETQALASITSIWPTSGNVDTEVTITGTGFQAIQGTGKVKVGGIDAFVVSWSETQIVAHPVGDYEPGTYTLLVQTNQGPSNSKNFAIFPQIDTLSPPEVKFGQQLTIRGKSFGTTSGTSVRFGSAGVGRASCVWTNTQIVVDVPGTATPGTIAVSANWTYGNAVDYTLLLPISSPALRRVETPTPISRSREPGSMPRRGVGRSAWAGSRWR